MAKSRFKAAGGGFLNSVDGVIKSYEFTTTHPFAKAGQKAKSDFVSLFQVLTIRVDGSQTDITFPLWGGDASNFEISDDGLTLTPIEDGYVLGGGTDLAHFIQSYDAVSEDGASGDDDTVVNYEPIIGQRVRFVQVPYSADELASLKRRGKPTTRKDKKDPKKEWPLQWLQVETVYGPAPVAAKMAGKVAGKASTKS